MTMKYIVIGLGTFGATLSALLAEMGHEVIGVDNEMARVQVAKESITHAVCLDATNEQALETLPIRSADRIIVGIGKDAGASIMTTALLRQKKVQHIISRAISSLHQTVLEAMGVEHIIHPERETAERLALKLEFDEVMDSYSLSDNYKIAEVQAPVHCHGQTIGELALPQKFNLIVLTIIRPAEKESLIGQAKTVNEILGAVKPGMKVLRGDKLVVFGSREDIRDFMES